MHKEPYIFAQLVKFLEGYVAFIIAEPYKRRIN